MADSRIGCLLVTALAALVLSAALVPSPVIATEEPAGDADDATITTVLHPGWNMVGWVGPETPASELFDDLPVLGRIFAWDGEEQRYQRLMPSSGSMDDQHLLAPGDGLWLYIGGTSPVEWTREASEDSVLLELRAGRNLVAWAGRDGTPIDEATVRFGERLVQVWRWDAGAQEYRLYAPSAGLDQVRELNHGDALRVELTEDARWWQSGLAAAPVEILGEYTELERWQIRGWVDGNRSFFAERWGVEAPVMTYVGDFESLALTYRRITGHGIAASWDGIYLSPENVIFLADDGVNGGTHAHEYFHAIQFHLMGSPQKAVPAWIREGSAVYARVLYGGTWYFRMLYPDWPAPSLSVEEQVDEYRATNASLGYGYWPSLSETEGGPDVTGPLPDAVYYDLGSLGIAWLADQVGDQAVIEFYRHLADKADWRDAFEAAFRMTSDTFHERFDAYRAEAAAAVTPPATATGSASTDLVPADPIPKRGPHAHEADSRDKPVLLFAADLPAETRSAVRAEFEGIQAFFSEQLGAGTADYTMYVISDEESGAPVHWLVFGRPPGVRFCNLTNYPTAAIINLRCRAPTYHLVWPHFVAVRGHLAPLSLVPAWPDGRRTRGPAWLDESAATYVEYRYHDAAGHADYENARSSEVTRARRIARPLSSMTSSNGLSGDEFWNARALGVLAVEWLVSRAGDTALFEYYRQLPESETWEEAFEGAFGLTVDKFYEAFEAYRAEVAPPDEGVDSS
jgi:hypothetical protein